MTIFLLVLVATSGVAQTKLASPQELTGKQSPDFDLAPLDGKMFDARDRMIPRRVTRANLRGKVVVLNVFATWCLPCKAEHPALLSLLRAYSNRDVEVFEVLIQDSRENGRRFVASGNGGIPILIPDNEQLADQFGALKGVPMTLITLYRLTVNNARHDSDN